MQLSKVNFITVASALCFSTALSCATAPPQELLDARAQYHRTAGGPAGKSAPAQVDTAKQALDRAEAAFKEDPKAPETRDLAYIAQRKAQLADAKAAIEISTQQKLKSEKDIALTNKTKLSEAKEDLKNAKQETQDSRVDLATAEQKNVNSEEKLADSKDQLAAEKIERQAAEDRNTELTASLAKIGTVKEDDRGTVISLSGGVLFASGKSTLLPNASSALDSVATALNSENKQTITIEGHTDSVGKPDFNQTLSRNRADAVRDYLISRGVEAARVTTIGFGSTHPVADNASAEGRANNRRVEIIISHRG